MNIFALDIDPTTCANYHCDRHVVKMILESCQMICTAHWIKPNRKVKPYHIPYKKTHVSHPCSIWVRSSISNYIWLTKLIVALNNEYKYRYGMNHDDPNIDHKSYTVCKHLFDIMPNINSDKGLTPFALAMPEQHKVKTISVDNSIISYRRYYKHDKAHLLSYTIREPPRFLHNYL